MADSSIPCLSYNDFGTFLKERIGQRRFPFTGSIEITPHCNLKCVHCYVSHCKQEANILSYAEVCRLLDEVANEGCLWILFTGGEPLVRPDFMDIYTYAKKKGIFVSLFTNGTLITPAIADYLYQWKPRAVEITLYGATKQTYERITGVAGSYERCLQGIELLAERRIPLRLKTMVLTINKGEIKQMQDYAQKLGIPFRYDPSIMPRLDKGLEPCQFRLTPEEIVEIELADPERIKDWREFCQRKLGAIDTDTLFVCNAGIHSFAIDSYGRLSLCISARSQTYDLRQGSFAEAWRDFLPKVRDQKAAADAKCSGCELVSMCGRCAAWAELETGDPQSEVEWLCRLAHLRLSSFGISVPAQIK